MTLRVSRTRRAVIVTLPPNCDLKHAGRFLNSNLGWVQEHLGEVPHPVAFAEEAVIPLRGEPFILSFSETLRRGAGIVQVDDIPGGKGRIFVRGSHDTAPRRLSKWLAEQARKDLDACVLHHSRTLHVRPKRITVRDQSSRWGSCSTTGALSFSWRLILAPPFVLDYVAAHEVAHLVEMNHGPAFWALVKKTMPRLAEAKEWLNVYGMDLHRYGA